MSEQHPQPSKPTPNTLIEADMLVPWITSSYDFGDGTVACELIRRGFNDNYLVRGGQERFVLRVYFNHKYYIASPNDFRFELDLLTYLSECGVPVAYPIQRRDGHTVGTINTPRGTRYAALFCFAEGVPADKDMGAEQARVLGDTIARLHLAADGFASPHPRYHLNLEYLLDRPMEQITAFLHEHGKEDDPRVYLPHVQELQEEAEALLPRETGAYGIIHGDLHGGNVHWTQDGKPTLFDFDHGGYGWRAYDLATCKGSLSEAAWDACLEGYRSVRALTEAEVAAIPLLRKLRPIWDQGDVLGMRPAWAEEFDAEFADNILKTLARVFGEAPKQQQQPTGEANN
jgi:Ser/Thr protein kinase RdoA (MazF antagonist)